MGYSSDMTSRLSKHACPHHNLSSVKAEDLFNTNTRNVPGTQWPRQLGWLGLLLLTQLCLPEQRIFSWEEG